MKKSLKNVVCLLALVAITAPSFAAIDGSAHDFEGATSWNTTDEICGVCHTPHGATAVGNAPLWAHDQITGDGYTMYSGVDMDWGTAPTAPDGESLLCLSCHDGSIPLDSSGTVAMGAVNADAVVGPDLSDSHPISFVYATSATDDPEIKTADGSITPLLGANGKVQCSSCHDVHDSADLGATGSLLRMSNTGSALCLTCHDK